MRFGDAAIAVVLVLAAQAPDSSNGPAFDVASIKPNKLDSNRVNFDLQPAGRFVATNVYYVCDYGRGPLSRNHNSP